MPTLGLGFSFGGKDAGLGRVLKTAESGLGRIGSLVTKMSSAFDPSRIAAFGSALSAVRLGAISDSVESMAKSFNKGLNAGDSFGFGITQAMAKVKKSMPATVASAEAVKRAMGEMMPFVGFQDFDTASERIDALRKAGFDIAKLGKNELRAFGGAMAASGADAGEFAGALGAWLPVVKGDVSQLVRLTDRVIAFGRNTGQGAEMAASLPKVLEEIKNQAYTLGEELTPEMMEKRTMSILALSNAFSAAGSSAGEAQTKAIEMFKTLQEKRRTIIQMNGGIQEAVSGFEDFAKEFILAGVDVGGVFDLLEKDPFNAAKAMADVFTQFDQNTNQGRAAADRFKQKMVDTFGGDFVHLVTHGQKVFEGSSEAMQASLKDFGGAAEKAGKAATEGLTSPEQALEAIEANWQRRLNNISGITTQVMVKEMGDRFKKTGDMLETLTAKNTGPLGELTKVLIGVRQRGFIALAIAVKEHLPAELGMLTDFSEILLDIGSTLMPVATAMGALGFRFSSLGKLMIAPITAVISVLGGLVGVIGLPGLIVAGLVGIGAALSTGMGDTLGDFFGSMKNKAADYLPGVLAFFDGLFGGKASSYVAELFGISIDGLKPEAIREKLTASFKNFSFDGIGDFLKGKLILAFDKLASIDWGGIGTTVVGYLFTGLKAAIGTLQSISRFLIDAVVGLFTGDGVAEGLAESNIDTALMDSAGNFANSFMDGAIETLASLWSNLTDFVAENAPTMMFGLFGGELVKEVLASVFGVGIEEVEAQFDRVGKTIKGVFNTVADTVIDVWDDIVAAGEIVFDTLSTLFDDVVKDVGGGTAGMKSGFDILISVIEGVVEYFAFMVKGISKGLIVIASGIKLTVGFITDTIALKIAEVIELFTIAKTHASEFFGVIGSFITLYVKVIARVVNGIVDAILSAFSTLGNLPSFMDILSGNARIEDVAAKIKAGFADSFAGGFKSILSDIGRFYEEGKAKVDKEREQGANERAAATGERVAAENKRIKRASDTVGELADKLQGVDKVRSKKETVEEKRKNDANGKGKRDNSSSGSGSGIGTDSKGDLGAGPGSISYNTVDALSAMPISAGSIGGNALSSENIAMVAGGPAEISSRAAAIIGGQAQTEALINALGFANNALVESIVYATQKNRTGPNTDGVIVTFAGDVRRFMKLSDVARATNANNSAGVPLNPGVGGQ